MNGQRLLLVTRYFWPQANDAQLLWADLCAGLAARGWPVSVLTTSWQCERSPRFDFCGARVLRLWPAPSTAWRTLGLVRTLRNWLVDHAGPGDLVYVSQLRHEAYAAVDAASRCGCRVILRAEAAGIEGDCHWQLEARFGQRIKRHCQRAAALVAPGPDVETELIAAGYPRDRIHRLFNGVAELPPREPNAVTAARESLCLAHPSLYLPAAAPLVLYLGPMEPHHGLEMLVEIWSAVIQKVPQARLWLVGEGSARLHLERRVVEQGLSPWVHLPGAFDDDEQLLQAADLLVAPSPGCGLSRGLLRGLAAGLPVLAADVPAHRFLLEPDRHGLVAAPLDARQWQRQLLRMLADAPSRTAWGESARQRWQTQFTLERMIEDHLALFTQLNSAAPC